MTGKRKLYENFEVRKNKFGKDIKHFTTFTEEDFQTLLNDINENRS